MMEIQVLRAQEEWQRAGAYAVRIQGMNRQYHIPLRQEFDEHDGNGTRYIVLLHDEYPVATGRFFTHAPGQVTIGRVVVLPEYRGKGLGARVMREAEQWARELGFEGADIDSRINAVGFYEKLGYTVVDDTVRKSGTFDCIHMQKPLK